MLKLNYRTKVLSYTHLLFALDFEEVHRLESHSQASDAMFRLPTETEGEEEALIDDEVPPFDVETGFFLPAMIAEDKQTPMTSKNLGRPQHTLKGRFPVAET